MDGFSGVGMQHYNLTAGLTHRKFVESPLNEVTEANVSDIFPVLRDFGAAAAEGEEEEEPMEEEEEEAKGEDA